MDKRRRHLWRLSFSDTPALPVIAQSLAADPEEVALCLAHRECMYVTLTASLLSAERQVTTMQQTYSFLCLLRFLHCFTYMMQLAQCARPINARLALNCLDLEIVVDAMRA